MASSQPDTLPQLFLDCVSERPSDQAVGWVEGSDVRWWTFAEYRRAVESMSLALRKHGLLPQEKAAILSMTRKEWNVLDLAIQAARGVVIPIYPSYTGEEVHYLIEHSGSVMIAVEDEKQLEKITAVLSRLPKLKLVLLLSSVSDAAKKKFTDGGGPRPVSFDELLAEGAAEMAAQPKAFEEMIRSAPGSDLASIIYTSGTTGEPKGAVVSQHAFACNLANVKGFLGRYLGKDDRMLTYLPLSHVLGRQDSLLILAFRWQMVFAESIDKLVANVGIARPSIMAAVPRVLEKIHAGVLKNASVGGLKEKIFHWALGVGRQANDVRDAGGQPGFLLGLKHSIASALVFKKVADRFGGRLRFFISGGAPLSIEIIHFLRAVNLTTLEGYGLTETLSGCVVNPPDRQIPGTVGKPIGDTQIRFLEDGEILLKTAGLFSEYYKKPAETAAAFNDGWFCTGDIGELTPEGYLKITDRKKDLIKTSGGKFIVPQKIEGALKLQPHVSQAVIVGERRNYATVLIGVDKEKLKDLLPSLGLNASSSAEDLAKSDALRKRIAADVETVNKGLAKYETIKKFFVVPEEFTIDGGLLTPSLKVKKKVALQRYEKDIEAMYASGGGGGE